MKTTVVNKLKSGSCNAGYRASQSKIYREGMSRCDVDEDELLVGGDGLGIWWGQLSMC